MSIIGMSFIPDNACPCEESEVIFKEVQKGVWEIVDWRCYGCAKDCPDSAARRRPDAPVASGWAWRPYRHYERLNAPSSPAGTPLWVCSACRDAIRPKHAQPEHLKRRQLKEGQR